MKSRNKIPVLILLVLYVQQANAQQAALDYPTFLHNVKQNHPLSAQGRNLSLIGDRIYRSARGLSDPVLDAVYDNKFYNGLNYYSVFGGALKQPVFTSQYLKIGHEYGYGPFVNPENYTGSSGLTYVGLEAGLLQGLMIDKRRAELLKRREYRNLYDTEGRIILNDLLYASASAYFDWLFLEAQLKTYRYFIRLANERNSGIRQFVLLGEKAAIDSVEAQILVRTREQEMQQVVAARQQKLNEVLQFNWALESVPAQADQPIVPADSLEQYYQKAQSIYLGISGLDTFHHPAVEQYLSKQKMLDIETRLKKEMIKPRLDVSYHFLLNEPEGSNYLFSPNRYKWGLSLSFPLFLRTPVNEYQAARLNAKNNTLELENKKNELALKLDALRKTAVLLIEQINTARENVTLSRLMMEAEKLKFDNGESSVFMINSRENKWAETELKLTQLKHKFIKTVLGMIYTRGDLSYGL